MPTEEPYIIAESSMDDPASIPAPGGLPPPGPPVQAMLAVRERSAVATRDELSVDDLLAQVAKLDQVVERAMHEGVHYGKVPGTDRPTLLKPGAERLCVVFRLAPTYPDDRLKLTWHEDGHFTVVATCVLRHIPTDLVVGEGLGLCSSLEKKYRWRTLQRRCPECGEPQIRKSKRDPEWYCWKKEGGCGATFPLDSDAGRQIEAQETGKTENPDVADTYNTVLKMAAKRALIAATLNGTAASDKFTQDVDDSDETPFEAGDAEAAAGPPGPRGITAQLAALEVFVLDARPWVKEAVESFYSDVAELREWADLPATVRDDAGRKLDAAIEFLQASKSAEGEEAQQALARQAFAKAFDGLVVEGPDPFQPPIPF